MAKMIGKTHHGVYCNCYHSRQNTPADKCHKKNGNKRGRAREKRGWRKEVVPYRNW